MSFGEWLTGGSRSEYVGRKVRAFRKEYVRTLESEGLKVDQTEFDLLTREIKHSAEDSWDRWSL